jgi:hypothetical protein
MKKGLKLKEALFWVILAGVAAHTALWLVAEASDNFYDASVYKLTRNLPKGDN